MKKILAGILSVLLFVSLLGCEDKTPGSSQSSATEQQTSTQTAEELSPEESIMIPVMELPLKSVEIEKSLIEKTITDDNENVLIEASLQLPVIKTEAPFAPADKINEAFKALSDAWFARLGSETKTQVMENKALDPEFFSVYTTDLSFEVTYHNNGILSILQFEYINAGGANPNSCRQCHTFDLNTGKLLEITDLMNGMPEEITSRVTDGFKAMVKENPENYFNNAKTLFADNPYSGFYLNEKSIVFYYQTEIIAPYAAGYPQYSIDYTDMEAFKVKLS